MPKTSGARSWSLLYKTPFTASRPNRTVPGAIESGQDLAIGSEDPAEEADPGVGTGASGITETGIERGTAAIEITAAVTLESAAIGIGSALAVTNEGSTVKFALAAAVGIEEELRWITTDITAAVTTIRGDRGITTEIKRGIERVG